MTGAAGTGARIRARRLDRGLRQAELAQAAGISAPYLNLIEHDRRRIGGKLLLALARALGVEPQALSEGAEAGLVAELGAAGAALGPAAATAAELAARFPEWARLAALQHRRIAELEETIEALSDRLSHDPRLAAALHEVLSTVTAIRSTAAILNEERDLARDWLDRFHRNLDADARRLAGSARDLVGYLEGEAAAVAPRSPQEAFETWLAAGGEGRPEGAEAAALADAWTRQAEADAALVPLDGDPADPLALAEACGQPLPTVFRRLAAGPGGWGLVTADAAGAILLRKPAAGFHMPRLGAACALWPLFLAPARPLQVMAGRIEQAGRVPRRFRYWALAEPVPGTGLTGPAVFRAHMLLAPEAAGSAGPAEPVGTTCRVCPRAGCPARREASVLPG